MYDTCIHAYINTGMNTYIQTI